MLEQLGVRQGTFYCYYCLNIREIALAVIFPLAATAAAIVTSRRRRRDPITLLNIIIES